MGGLKGAVRTAELSRRQSERQALGTSAAYPGLWQLRGHSLRRAPLFPPWEWRGSACPAGLHCPPGARRLGEGLGDPRRGTWAALWRPDGQREGARGRWDVVACALPRQGPGRCRPLPLPVGSWLISRPPSRVWAPPPRTSLPGLPGPGPCAGGRRGGGAGQPRGAGRTLAQRSSRLIL